MPSKNRPLVRDGRIQAKKKRTDRSYLGSAPSPATAVEEPATDEAVDDAEPAQETADTVAEAAPAVEAPVAAAAAPAPAGSTAAPGRLPTTVRAMQQQGVRKRRGFDVHALALRDSQYAIHEMRRIFILAVMVITTLVVLGFLLR